MVVLFKQILSALAGLILSGAVPAASMPSPPEAIVNAAVDCWEAASGPVLNEAQLKSRGWLPGAIQTPDGKPVAKAPRVYGKDKSGIMLLVLETPAAKGCIILSAVSKPSDIGQTATLLLRRLKAIDPQVKGGRKGQTLVYISASRVAQLEGTGSQERPGMRIAIAYTPPEKK